tara:strand:- start:276 stop:719 length:444 start_codon:yes stop_codon:yes gene_type:complete
MTKIDTFDIETTHRIRDTCFCLHAQRAARALARRFDEALRPVGLTNGQFSLLTALNRPAPWSIGPLADLLAMDRTTLTAKLKPLLRRGLVELDHDPADRRNRRISLTDDGFELLKTALPLWQRTHEEVDALVGASADRLRADLKALS